MWAFAGICVVMLLAAVWIGRRLRNGDAADPNMMTEAAEFLVAVLDEVRSLGPEIEFRGTLPGSFAIILSVHGQEVPVALDQLYHHYRAFPSQLPEMITSLVEEVEEVAMERPTDHPFGEVATEILPQMRRLGWIHENGPAFGDSALVHRNLGPDLAVCYVIDSPWSMVFLCQAHLRQWGLSEQDVFQLARQNLAKRGAGDIPLPDAEHASVVLNSGDGYDAARLLLLDPSCLDGLLIAMPEQEVLWLGQESQHRLESLMSANQAQNSGASHPVSPELYRMVGEQLVPVSGPPSA